VSEGLTKLQAAEELHFRKKAQESLLFYTENTHPRWETSEHHIRMCSRLEQLERLDTCECCGRLISKLAFFAPPRHSKTELASRRFPSWCMGKHPEWQMICAQATGRLAADTGADVRDIVKSPEFQRVFDVTLREDARAAERWVTDSGGVYFAAGVDGAIVGRGANLLVIDDPHRGRQDADSERMRDIAGNWYFGDAITRTMPDDEGGCARQLLILTRWHEDDLAGRILGTEADWHETEDSCFFCCDSGWHVLKMEAISNEGSENERALWSSRYPLNELHEKRSTMQDAGRNREWQSQYQQRPTVEEGSFLKRWWFDNRYDTLPAGARMYITTDFAVTKKETQRKQKKKPARTELIVLAHCPDDRVYVVDCVSLVSSSDVWIERLIELAKQYDISAGFGEKGVIKNAIEPFLERALEDEKYNLWMTWMPTTEDKLARGSALQAWAARGKLVFPRGGSWVSEMIDELVAVGGGGFYWDKFDACAHFFLAIDQNHPAILRPDPVTQKLPDGWRVWDGGIPSWRLGRTA
jgi:predicted phage terminase large subunit-like protein